MKIPTILIFALFLSRCGATKSEEFDKYVNKMICPVTLVAIMKDPLRYSAVILKDGQGKLNTFTYLIDAGNSAHAVADSRAVGDTIKFCK